MGGHCEGAHHCISNVFVFVLVFLKLYLYLYLYLQICICITVLLLFFTWLHWDSNRLPLSGGASYVLVKLGVSEARR